MSFHLTGGERRRLLAPEAGALGLTSAISALFRLKRSHPNNGANVIQSLKPPALSVLASVMLSLLPVTGLVGCASSESDDVSEVAEVRQQVITAETISGLKAGEQLMVDLREKDAAYTFDFSQAPIDFSRITLIHGNGNTQTMDQWLSTSKANGGDPLAAPDHKFHMAPSAQSFGFLSTTEAAELQSTGKLVKKLRGSSLSAESRSAMSTVTDQALICYDIYVLRCEQRPPYNDVYDCWLEYVGTVCEETEP